MRVLLSKISNWLKIVGFLALASCGAGLAPGGAGTGPVTNGTSGPNGPVAESFGLGDQAKAAPEMPEIMVGPSFDGQTDPSWLTKKSSEVRIRAEVTVLCQNPQATPPTVTKRIKGQVECRWAGTNDPYVPCGRERYFRIFDNLSFNFVDVLTDAEGAFSLNFTFNLTLQTAMQSDTVIPAETKSDAPATITESAFGFSPSRDSAVSDETDLVVYLSFYDHAGLNQQTSCTYEVFCVGAKWWGKLGAFVFPAGHVVSGPDAATESCQP